MAGMFDQLPANLQQQWRMNSAKGGAAATGASKSRACKIGWANSPNRFDKRKERNLEAREREPKPSGFFCTQCGKWHDYPKEMPARVDHRCACGSEHRIVKLIAKLKKTKAQA